MKNVHPCNGRVVDVWRLFGVPDDFTELGNPEFSAFQRFQARLYADDAGLVIFLAGIAW
jgi:hypothetical protein